MDYDQVRNISGPDPSTMNRFYEEYLKPYMTEEADELMLISLYEMAQQAWTLGVKRAEILTRTRLVLWMMEQLATSHPNDCIELVSVMQDQFYDTSNRTNAAERNAYNAKQSKNPDRIFGDLIRLYKVFFENEFRLWGAGVYFYLCRTVGLKNSGTTPESFVHVSGAEKFHAISDLKICFPLGYPRDLCEGFDNEIRNAGEGHDSWEVTDRGTMLLSVRDPKTGLLKGSRQIEFTVNSLENQILLCRRSIWHLRAGYLLFMNNNPQFARKVRRIRQPKCGEIEAGANNFAETRWLKIKTFDINKDRTELRATLQYCPRVLGEMGRLLFSNGECYDLVKITEKVRYAEQVMGVLQFICWSGFDYANLPTIHVTVEDNNDSVLAKLSIPPNELRKLYKPASERTKPIPSDGVWPDAEYDLAYNVRVPAGKRAQAEEVISEWRKSGRLNFGSGRSNSQN